MSGVGLEGVIGAVTAPGEGIEPWCTLSAKHREKFELTDISENVFKYIYKGGGALSGLEIPRYAVYPITVSEISPIGVAFDLSSIATYVDQTQPLEGKLFPLEKIIFSQAVTGLANSHSADRLIRPDFLSPSSPTLSTSTSSSSSSSSSSSPPTLSPPSSKFPNNVVLVDIFATDKPKRSSSFKTKKDPEKPGFAEIHTVCIWKKRDNELMIIDPSNSEFSERLHGIESILPPDSRDLTYHAVKHFGNKFYTKPENVKFCDNILFKATNRKVRDCIDVALKIAIVLNEGVMFYKTTVEIQNSINLLSNQSSVNSILEKINNECFYKHLQSTQKDKRLRAIAFFSSIPLIFRQQLPHFVWQKFVEQNDDRQRAIIQALNIKRTDEFSKRIIFTKISDVNILPDEAASNRTELQFERLTRFLVYDARMKELEEQIKGLQDEFKKDQLFQVK